MFHTFTEGYINWNHMGLVCIVFRNLVTSWPNCVSETERCAGNYPWLLSHQLMGLLVH